LRSLMIVLLNVSANPLAAGL